MADLKTNYVDDVLDSSKNQLRKYQQIQNDDGTVSFVDVTEYSTTGTSFGAKDINDTNTAVNELNNSLGRILIKQSYSTAQDIALPDNNYDYIECYFLVLGGNTQVLSPVKIEKGEIGACFLSSVNASLSTITTYERRVRLSSDGITLTLYDNVVSTYSNGSYSSGTINLYLTLEKVVAYKYSSNINTI